MNVHGKDIKIFACNANRAVAEEIADILGVPLGDMQVKSFADGEVAVSMNESVRGSDVFLVQSTCNPVNDHLMEMLVTIDALKRASAGRITAVIPYYGYARQDRKAKPRDPISAKLVADLLVTAGADRVLTMDLHAPQIQGFFNIPVDHLVGAPLLAKYYGKKFESVPRDDLIIVSPDVGSVPRARMFSHSLNCSIAIVDKRRPRPNVSEVMNIIGNVKGKTCIILDDMVDTAGTLCNAANALVTMGGASEVYAGATHGVLSGPALDRIEQSVIRELVLLDTIPLVKNTPGNKIRMLNIAPIFAEAIRRIYGDEPLCTLYD